MSIIDCTINKAKTKILKNLCFFAEKFLIKTTNGGLHISNWAVMFQSGRFNRLKVDGMPK